MKLCGTASPAGRACHTMHMHEVWPQGKTHHIGSRHCTAGNQTARHHAPTTLEIKRILTQRLVAVQVESAEMLSVDRLGITTQCRPKRAPDQRVNVRLAFPEPAETRGAVKEQLVAMTRAAAAAAQPAAAEAAAK